MKNLSLNGKEIRLLKKISDSCLFFKNVQEFIKKKEYLPDKEVADIEIDENEFIEVIEMIADYLDSSSLTEKERNEFKELKERLVVFCPGYEEDREVKEEDFLSIR